MKALKVIYLILFLSLIVLACKENDPVSPLDNQSDAVPEKQNSSPKNITVMTRNIYVGTDVDRLLMAEDPEQIPLIVTELMQMLEATNFPDRAVSLAQEIAATQPHLIGLQEVSLFRIQSPGDFVLGGKSPAKDVLIDYLDVLLQTMASMDLHYEVAAKVENFDIELPMVTSQDPTFDDIRLTDYDVILVKKGIKISNVEERNYRVKLTIPEMGIEIPRGYCAVTAEINGMKYRFVNTHLEDADQGGPLLKIQLAQAAELLIRLAKVKIPVILVGDFNSAAQDEPTYRLVTLTNRYKDTWLLNSSVENPDGFTYGHDLDLLNTSQKFWKRIDHVFVREEMNIKGLELIQVTAEVIG
ncbi:MAG: endonuclease/exonuclease/phosphatase family protein, partial [Ignavibacteriae bacterium]|nr:endonuclease/exonuclease/phosphatase family protein [Ignavibacteriota bacterium]